MSTVPNQEPELRRFSIRLPRPLWIGLATVVLATAYGGLYRHNFRTGPVLGDERTGLRYFLDYERGVAHAKLWNKPVFVYFTGTNCVNARRMEKDVLRAPAVTGCLRQFICVELFVDSVPTVADRMEAARLLAQNVKLQEEWLGDVFIPAFAVIDPVFDLERDAGRHEQTAKAISLITDEAKFIRFLDDALEKWAKSRSSERPLLPVSTGY